MMPRCPLPPPPADSEDLTPVIPTNQCFNKNERRFLRVAIRFAIEMSDESVVAHANRLERILKEAD